MRIRAVMAVEVECEAGELDEALRAAVAGELSFVEAMALVAVLGQPATAALALTSEVRGLRQATADRLRLVPRAA